MIGWIGRSHRARQERPNDFRGTAWLEDRRNAEVRDDQPAHDLISPAPTRTNGADRGSAARRAGPLPASPAPRCRAGSQVTDPAACPGRCRDRRAGCSEAMSIPLSHRSSPSDGVIGCSRAGPGFHGSAAGRTVRDAQAERAQILHAAGTSSPRGRADPTHQAEAAKQSAGMTA